MHIRAATSDDIPRWAQLRHELWPHHSLEELKSELPDMLAAEGLVGVAEDMDGALVGFIEISIRHDYVEGTTTANPLPYLEGWYVSAELRGQGVGKKLVEFTEQWARDAGHHEFASDAYIDNAVSIAAHKAIGFQEVGRVVHFLKTL